MTHVVEELSSGNVFDSNGDVRLGADYRNLDYGYVELPDAEEITPRIQEKVILPKQPDDDDEREDAYSELGGGVSREPLTPEQEDAMYRIGLGGPDMRRRVEARRAGVKSPHGAELARRAIATAEGQRP